MNLLLLLVDKISFASDAYLQHYEKLKIDNYLNHLFL